MFVAAGNQLEKQVRRVLLEGDVADLVDDEQTDAPQLDQLGREPPSLSSAGAHLAGRRNSPIAQGGHPDRYS